MFMHNGTSTTNFMVCVLAHVVCELASHQPARFQFPSDLHCVVILRISPHIPAGAEELEKRLHMIQKEQKLIQAEAAAKKLEAAAAAAVAAAAGSSGAAPAAAGATTAAATASPTPADVQVRDSRASSWAEVEGFVIGSLKEALSAYSHRFK
jgi:hypothetical protein